MGDVSSRILPRPTSRRALQADAGSSLGRLVRSPAVAVADGATFWSLRTRLTLVGCATEILGVVLLAFDLVAEPALEAASRSWRVTRTWLHRVAARLTGRQRVFGASIASGGIVRAGGRVRAQLIPAAIEEQIAELRREIVELDHRLYLMDGTLRSKIAQVRDELLEALALRTHRRAYRLLPKSPRPDADVWRSPVGVGRSGAGNPHVVANHVVGVMQHRFRILDEAGNDLGPFASRRSDWSSGDRLARWHGETLEVVSVVDAEPEDPVTGYIVVRRV